MLFILNKEGNPAICDNVDETGRCYAKWNKPGTERKILHETHVESKTARLIDTEGKTVIARCWGQREMEKCWSKGTKVSYTRGMFWFNIQ